MPVTCRPTTRVTAGIVTIDLNRYAVIEQLRALDFEPPVPCRAEECGRLAEWALTILCPSLHGSLMCTAHHDSWQEKAGRAAAIARRAICADCPPDVRVDLPKPFYTWRHL
jgi:hypothetical protein